MGTFGGGLFGGGGGGATPGNVGVPLSTIVQRSYRIAGITKWVGTTPQDDWFTEAIAETNAMIGGLNTSRLNIFTVAINAFNIGGGTKVFLVGPGATPQVIAGVSCGAFDMARPQRIQAGVIGLGPAGTNGLVRVQPPMYQMNDAEWSNITLQDIPNGIPLAFYYDGSYDPASGFGLIYLWTQTTESYSVEWYTWQAIPKFATKNDQVALPDGYEDLLVYCLAERLAALNPHQQNMQPESYNIARRARATLQNYNAPIPKPYVNDAACVGQSSTSGNLHWDYRTGTMR